MKSSQFLFEGQRIPFDLTCFYSPSEGSSEDENLSDTADTNQNKKVKRRKMRHKKVLLSLTWM